jgi:hypothetical protein
MRIASVREHRFPDVIRECPTCAPVCACSFVTWTLWGFSTSPRARRKSPMDARSKNARPRVALSSVPGSSLQARLLRRSKLVPRRPELSASGNTASALRATQPLLL